MSPSMEPWVTVSLMTLLRSTELLATETDVVRDAVLGALVYFPPGTYLVTTPIIQSVS